MSVLIFISYATSDSEVFHVAEIAEKLTEFPEIQNVLYWEEDMDDDILDYMENNINRCDAFLLFCSENASNSKPVRLEWQAALKKDKKIIPVFMNEEDIPALLSPKLGVQFNQEDLDIMIDQIYNLILKKLNLKKKSIKKALNLSEGNNLEKIGKKIHEIFFSDKESIRLNNIEYPIGKYEKSGIKYLNFGGYYFVEQNPNKNSKWGQKARKGHQISWIIKGKRYIAQIIDGEFQYLKEKK